MANYFDVQEKTNRTNAGQNTCGFSFSNRMKERNIMHNNNNNITIIIKQPMLFANSLFAVVFTYASSLRCFLSLFFSFSSFFLFSVYYEGVCAFFVCSVSVSPLLALFLCLFCKSTWFDTLLQLEICMESTFDYFLLSVFFLSLAFSMDFSKSFFYWFFCFALHCFLHIFSCCVCIFFFAVVVVFVVLWLLFSTRIDAIKLYIQVFCL